MKIIKYNLILNNKIKDKIKINMKLKKKYAKLLEIK